MHYQASLFESSFGDGYYEGEVIGIEKGIGIGREQGVEIGREQMTKNIAFNSLSLRAYSGSVYSGVRKVCRRFIYSSINVLATKKFESVSFCV